MLTRISLGHEGNMANWDHLIGSLVITIAVCSMAEVARPARLLIIPLACALLITPFIYNVSTGSLIITLACALALIALSLPKGRSQNQFGTWNHRIL
jgi:hypothetical protein